MLAPICLFTYSRLDETQKTVQALQKNYLASESDLFIFSDGYKNETDKPKVRSVRRYLHSIDGFNSIHISESPVNKGLADSIISGVSQIIEEYGKVIVLEDDLITSPNFLDFMNQALNYYENEEMVQSINGFSLDISSENRDIYFQVRPFSWGWATWKKYWRESIFDKETISYEIESNDDLLRQFQNECGNDISKMLIDSVQSKNDSWYVRWAYNHFKNKRFSVYPSHSLVENIGFGENSTHCKGINTYKYIKSDPDKRNFRFISFKEPSIEIKNNFLKYFSKKYKLFVRLSLLFNHSGRRQLLNELVSKFGIL